MALQYFLPQSGLYSCMVSQSGITFPLSPSETSLSVTRNICYWTSGNFTDASGILLTNGITNIGNGIYAGSGEYAVANFTKNGTDTPKLTTHVHGARSGATVYTDRYIYHSDKPIVSPSSVTFTFYSSGSPEPIFRNAELSLFNGTSWIPFASSYTNTTNIYGGTPGDNSYWLRTTYAPVTVDINAFNQNYRDAICSRVSLDYSSSGIVNVAGLQVVVSGDIVPQINQPFHMVNGLSLTSGSLYLTHLPEIEALLVDKGYHYSQLASGNVRKDSIYGPRWFGGFDYTTDFDRGVFRTKYDVQTWRPDKGGINFSGRFVDGDTTQDIPSGIVYKDYGSTINSSQNDSTCHGINLHSYTTSPAKALKFDNIIPAGAYTVYVLGTPPFSGAAIGNPGDWGLLLDNGQASLQYVNDALAPDVTTVTPSFTLIGCVIRYNNPGYTVYGISTSGTISQIITSSNSRLNDIGATSCNISGHMSIIEAGFATTAITANQILNLESGLYNVWSKTNANVEGSYSSGNPVVRLRDSHISGVFYKRYICGLSGNLPTNWWDVAHGAPTNNTTIPTLFTNDSGNIVHDTYNDNYQTCIFKMKYFNNDTNFDTQLRPIINFPNHTRWIGEKKYLATADSGITYIEFSGYFARETGFPNEILLNSGALLPKTNPYFTKNWDLELDTTTNHTTGFNHQLDIYAARFDVTGWMTAPNTSLPLCTNGQSNTTSGCTLYTSGNYAGIGAEQLYISNAVSRTTGSLYLAHIPETEASLLDKGYHYQAFTATGNVRKESLYSSRWSSGFNGFDRGYFRPVYTNSLSGNVIHPDNSSINYSGRFVDVDTTQTVGTEVWYEDDGSTSTLTQNRSTRGGINLHNFTTTPSRLVKFDNIIPAGAYTVYALGTPPFSGAAFGNFDDWGILFDNGVVSLQYLTDASTISTTNWSQTFTPIGFFLRYNNPGFTVHAISTSGTFHQIISTSDSRLNDTGTTNCYASGHVSLLEMGFDSSALSNNQMLSLESGMYNVFDKVRGNIEGSYTGADSCVVLKAQHSQSIGTNYKRFICGVSGNLNWWDVVHSEPTDRDYPPTFFATDSGNVIHDRYREAPDINSCIFKIKYQNSSSQLDTYLQPVLTFPNHTRWIGEAKLLGTNTSGIYYEAFSGYFVRERGFPTEILLNSGAILVNKQNPYYAKNWDCELNFTNSRNTAFNHTVNIYAARFDLEGWNLASTSNVPLYVSGIGTSHSGVDFTVWGPQTSTSEIPLFTQVAEYASTNSGVTLFITNESGALSGTTELYIAGANFASGDFPIYLAGNDLARPSGNVSLFLECDDWRTTSGNTTLYVNSVVHTSSGNASLFLSSRLDSSGNAPLITVGGGFARYSGDTTLYLQGPILQSGVSTLNLFTANYFGTIQSGVDLSVSNQVISSGLFPINIIGGGLQSDSGTTTLVAWHDIFPVSGTTNLTLWNTLTYDSTPLYLKAKESTVISGGVDLSIFSASNSGLAGDLNLFTQADVTNKNTPLFVAADSTGGTNSIVPLYVKNGTAVYNALNLAIKSRDSLNSGVYLTTIGAGLLPDGFVSNSGITLYIARPSESVGNSVYLSVRTASGEAGGMDLVVAGGTYKQSGVNLYMPAFGHQSGRVTLFSRGF